MLCPFAFIWSLTGDTRDFPAVHLSETSPPGVLVGLVDYGVPYQRPRRGQGPWPLGGRLGIRFRQLPIRGPNHGAVRDPGLAERRILRGRHLLGRACGVAFLVDLAAL